MIVMYSFTMTAVSSIEETKNHRNGAISHASSTRGYNVL